MTTGRGLAKAEFCEDFWPLRVLGSDFVLSGLLEGKCVRTNIAKLRRRAMLYLAETALI